MKKDGKIRPYFINTYKRFQNFVKLFELNSKINRIDSDFMQSPTSNKSVVYLHSVSRKEVRNFNVLFLRNIV